MKIMEKLNLFIVTVAARISSNPQIKPSEDEYRLFGELQADFAAEKSGLAYVRSLLLQGHLDKERCADEWLDDLVSALATVRAYNAEWRRLGEKSADHFNNAEVELEAMIRGRLAESAALPE